MKRWTTFGMMLALVGGALVLSQIRKTSAPVSPDALLFFVADTQHELTRLPAKFTRLSDEDEISIGNNMARWYLGREAQASQDASAKVVQAYVNSVGGRVAAHAQRRLPYKFHYIPDPNFVNAFALPGGHVFIGAGMMGLMDSEDELAIVLGHEVEHIDHYHCAERLQTESTLRHIPLGEMVEFPVVVFEAGYSKTQELEADREGTRLAVKAGYSPLGAIRMFQAFDRLEQQRNRAQTPGEELSNIAWQTLEGYFRSHPLPAERIAQIQKMISDEQWEQLTSEKPLEVEYVFLTARAAKAMDARNYAGAETVAARSLEIHLDQPAAVRILAEAQFAQGKFAQAKENYAKLVNQTPTEAGAVAEFANILATVELGSGHYDQAAKFAGASLDLQPNNAKGLAILAEAQLSLADFSAAAASYAKLKNLYPQESANVLTYISEFDASALQAHRFAQAAGVAAFWLTLEPGRREALTIQARAGLALGNFATSAAAFRNLLDLTPKDQYVDMDLVWSYADALSAAGAPQESAREFGAFMAEPRLTTPALDSQIKVEWAGLRLLAGDGAPAEELIRNGQAGVSGVAPEHLTRLGWWYYRAKQYAAANTLLRNLSDQRPGDMSIQHNLAWVELELNETDKAMVRFRIPQEASTTNPSQWNTQQMGLAIALWKTHNFDDAIKAYEVATQAEPRWLDARLVRAFYSSMVVQTVAELQIENTKRIEAKRQRR